MWLAYEPNSRKECMLVDTMGRVAVICMLVEDIHIAPYLVGRQNAPNSRDTDRAEHVAK